GYRSALGVLGLERRFGRDRLEAACERALTHNTVRYASVQSILITGLDKASEPPAPISEAVGPVEVPGNARRTLRASDRGYNVGRVGWIADALIKVSADAETDQAEVARENWTAG